MTEKKYYNDDVSLLVSIDNALQEYEDKDIHTMIEPLHFIMRRHIKMFLSIRLDRVRIENNLSDELMEKIYHTLFY